MIVSHRLSVSRAPGEGGDELVKEILFNSIPALPKRASKDDGTLPPLLDSLASLICHFAVSPSGLLLVSAPSVSRAESVVRRGTTNSPIRPPSPQSGKAVEAK